MPGHVESSTQDTRTERFTRAEAAAILGVHIRTLDSWIASRHIGHVRHVGRIYVTAENLDEFWRNSRRAAWVQPELPFGEVAS